MGSIVERGECGEKGWELKESEGNGKEREGSEERMKEREGKEREE